MHIHVFMLITYISPHTIGSNNDKKDPIHADPYAYTWLTLLDEVGQVVVWEDLCDPEDGEGIVAVQQLCPQAAAQEALEQLGVHQQVVLHKGFPTGPGERRGSGWGLRVLRGHGRKEDPPFVRDSPAALVLHLLAAGRSVPTVSPRLNVAQPRLQHLRTQTHVQYEHTSTYIKHKHTCCINTVSIYRVSISIYLYLSGSLNANQCSHTNVEKKNKKKNK